MFTIEDAKAAVILVGIKLDEERWTLSDLTLGMNVELEHGIRAGGLDITGDDPVLSAKIAMAHLRHTPDYYTRLERMLSEADSAAVMALAVESDLGVG